MHEQSETVGRPGAYRNIYGKATPKAGQTLPKKYPFESDAGTYPTIKSAVRVARKRSQLEGTPKGKRLSAPPPAGYTVVPYPKP